LAYKEHEIENSMQRGIKLGKRAQYHVQIGLISIIQYRSLMTTDTKTECGRTL